jgi:hypothetical protein
VAPETWHGIVAGATGWHRMVGGRSILRYVILQQTHPRATVFHRKGQDWVAVIVQANGTLSLPEIALDIPLVNLYGDLGLAPDPDNA